MATGRIRSRAREASIKCTDTIPVQPGVGAPVSSTYTEPHWVYSHEHMTDNNNNWDRSDKSVWHWKSELVAAPGSPPPGRYYYPWGAYFDHATGGGDNPYCPPGLNAVSASGYLDWDPTVWGNKLPNFAGSDLFYQNLIDNATKAWTPIPKQMDLANSIFELGDTKSLATTFLSTAKRLALARGGIHTALGGRDILNMFSDNLLATQFGLRPMIKDIQDLAAAWYRIGTRLRWLQKTRGVKTTMVHTAHTGLTIPPPSNWQSNGDSPGTWVTADIQIDIVLRCKLNHTLENLDGIDGAIRAFSNYAGFTQPYKIVWNAIPLSFTVDWLFGVGNALERLQLPTFGGLWKLDNYLTTCKMHGLVSTWWKYNYPTNAIHRSSLWKVEKFHRFVGLPAIPYTLGDLSWLQQMLLGGLTWQRVKDLPAVVKILGDGSIT